LVEGDGEDPEAGGEAVKGSELVVVQEEFLDVVVVGVVEEGQFGEAVVGEGQFAQGLEVVEADGGEGEVVAEEVFAPGSSRDCQPSSAQSFDDHCPFIKVSLIDR
jgi:hypothetical protein